MAVDEELANGLLKYKPMEMQERFHRSNKRIKVLVGGNGCLASETQIYDPVDAMFRRVDSITGEFHVYARDVDGKTVIAHAQQPFVKAIDYIFEITISSGQRFLCSAEHKVLAINGEWVTVSEAWDRSIKLVCSAEGLIDRACATAVRPRCTKAESQQQSRSKSLTSLLETNRLANPLHVSHQPSSELQHGAKFSRCDFWSSPVWQQGHSSTLSCTSQSMLEDTEDVCVVSQPMQLDVSNFQNGDPISILNAPYSGALRLSGTLSVCWDGCRASLRHDEQLRIERGDDLDFARRRSDVRRRIPVRQRLGALANRSGYSHSFSFSPPSSVTPIDRCVRDMCDEEYQETSCGVARSHPSSRDAALPYGKTFLRSSRVDTELLWLGYESSSQHITGIRFVRKDLIWDFHVPVFNNYLLSGCWHHNSGKTFSGVAEICYQAMDGCRKGVLPVHIWSLRQNFPKLIDVDPIFVRAWLGDEVAKPFVPSGMQKGVAGNPKSIMRLTNGSTISIRSWSQGWKSVQGEMPDMIHVDEECDDEMFRELKVRMFRKSRGQIVVTVTDTVAEPWLLSLLEEAERGSPNVDAFRIDTRDNIYIDQEQVAAFSADMDDIEKAVRLGGGLRMASGRVYKCWSDDNWRDPEELPLDGSDYCLVDPGIASPCAVLWVRVTRPERRMVRPGIYEDQSDMWLFAEHYQRGESDIKKHVMAIWQKNQELGSRPLKYLIDPWSGHQRIASVNSTRTVIDVWTQAGIPVVAASSRREMYRLERFREMERWVKKADTTRGNMYAVRGMVNFNRELFKYVVSGLVDPNTRASSQRKELFRGDNHLIWGAESAAVMRLPYVSRATALSIKLSGLDHAANLAWHRISTGERLFTSSELGAQVERTKPA